MGERRRLGPHPKILAITGEPGLGHPMVRALQGTWVSRQQGLWVSGYLRTLHNAWTARSATGATLDRYAAHERAMLIEDIKKNPTDRGAWSTISPIAGATGCGIIPMSRTMLRDYRLVATVNDIEVRFKAN